MRTEIIIPSSGVIDLYDDVTPSLNYNIADIRTPDKRNADFSKTILAPGTANNNKLLAHIFEIGTDRLFNPNHKTNAEIVVDKVSVMKGILRLARINTLRDNKIEYEFEFKGRIDDLFTAIKDNILTDIDWDDLNHNYERNPITNSWTATVGVGYVYPFIDHGSGGQVMNEEEVVSFRPATYVKEIWDRIFSFAGYQYSSTFINTDFFKRLIIPFTSENFVRTQTQIQNSIFYANRNSNQSFTVGQFNQVVFTQAIFNNDSVSPASDAGGVYNPATGEYTCGQSGNYSFETRVTIHYQHNAANFLTYSPQLTILRNNVNAAATGMGSINVNPGSPGADITGSVTWSGFLIAGEVLKVRVTTGISNPNNVAFPAVETNYIATDSYFRNTLSAEYTAGSLIEYGNAVPQQVKMQDFLMSIIKMFNLYFEYDKDTPNKIHIEPRDDYYNTTVQDWSTKLDESQILLIEPMGALNHKRYILKYKPDKDWMNEKYQASFQQVKDESYGLKVKTVDNDFLSDDYIVEPIFSPTPLYSDTTSDRIYPRIIKVDPVNNNVSPLTANIRILYYGGLKSCQAWTFYDYDNVGPTSVSSYPFAGHIDDPTNPTIDLSWGVPKVIYYQPPWQATYTNNNLYNRFWSKFISEITDKDSSIVTGWFHLTPADIALLDFRHIYRFRFQNYRLNKVYDYNPVKEGLTKCEFIKTKDAVPFVYENILTLGVPFSKFNGTQEPGPKITPALGNPVIGVVKPGKLVSEGGNWVPESATSGIIVIGIKNIVGENAKIITIIQSSGVTVIHNNVTMIQSSGITSTGDNQLWIYNQLVTSGDIYNLTHCAEEKTVAQMQALATSNSLHRCRKYLITDPPAPMQQMLFHAFSSGAIYPEGVGITSGTTYVVGYDLTTNEITKIYDRIYNNIVNRSLGSGYNNIENFPWANVNWQGNTLNDCDLTVNNPNICTMLDSSIYGGSVSMNDGGAIQVVAINGSNVKDSTVILTGGSSGQTHITDSSVISSIVTFTNGANSNGMDLFHIQLVSEGTPILGRFTYGDNLLTLPSHHSAYDKCELYSGTTNGSGYSNITESINVPATTFDFSISGVNYSFAGIILCTTTANRTITVFANFDTTYKHTVRFYGSATHTIRFIHDGAGIFLINGAAIGSITLGANVNHWIEFRFTAAGVAYEEAHYNI